MRFVAHRIPLIDAYAKLLSTNMDPEMQSNLINRRLFLSQAGKGLGLMALGNLLNPGLSQAGSQGNLRLLHIPPKAKRVIFLCMAGGPSHLESFDYKPELAKMDGKPMPESFTQGQPIAQLQGKNLVCKGPLKPFKPYGNCGRLISDYFPYTGQIADEICVMQTGTIVEKGDRAAIFDHAEHPYTQKLLAAIPSGGKEDAVEHDDTLVRVENLRTWFDAEGQIVKAVDDVSFDIRRGEVLGLVGESGSGKSTIGRSLLRLVPVTGGTVTFDGTDVTALEGRALKDMRRRMQMIFQDPFASLNPRMTVFDTLAEPLLLHGIENRKSVAQAVLKLMDDVGLVRSAVRKYPHEFSGGQRQRIAIGRALATRPEFVVADEPVSALDVTIQAQILELMQELGREYGLTMLFVSHDLAVVRHLADRIIVLYQGRIVEEGSGEQLFTTPREAYTQQLLSAIPGHSLGSTPAVS